jgi:hypothetical protein
MYSVEFTDNGSINASNAAIKKIAITTIRFITKDENNFDIMWKW